ncbi:hypothetical protein LUZ60_008026 [Juncus effusus]|nr:hypothetical protein LUZ60_008026 [Juncus effusus]
MELNKAILCLLFSASLLSASVTAGRYRKPINQVTEREDVSTKDNSAQEAEIDDGGRRVLTARTNDYGGFDPTPTFSRPRFKRIPN